MIDTILYTLLILFLSSIGCYIGYFFIKNNLVQKVEKEWQEKNDQLKSWEKSLRSQYAQMEWDSAREKNNISQQKSEAIKEYEKAFSAIKVAEKIRDDSHLKINDLQKRVDQLQSELFQARQRAERFAKKSKNAVQISA